MEEKYTVYFNKGTKKEVVIDLEDYSTRDRNGKPIVIPNISDANGILRDKLKGFLLCAVKHYPGVVYVDDLNEEIQNYSSRSKKPARNCSDLKDIKSYLGRITGVSDFLIADGYRYIWNKDAPVEICKIDIGKSEDDEIEND